MPALSLSRPRLMARGLRYVLPVLVASLCAWALWTRLDGLDLRHVLAQTRAVPLANWMGACLATAVSFWAIGRYDAVAHRHFGTRVGARRARAAGMVAIAVAQTLGFGVISGAFARWRLLPGLTPVRATQIAMFVAVSFLVALAVLGVLACLIAPPLPWIRVPAFLGLVALLCLPPVLMIWPRLQLARWRMELPSLPAVAGIQIWTAVDTAAAALALYILLPAEVSIPFATFFSVYLLALGAALLSGVPGGAGPFELTLLALLPGVAPADLLAGIAAFRLIFYAAPALLGAGVLAWPRGLRLLGGRVRRLRDPSTRALPQDRPRAEAGLVRQNGGHVWSWGGAALPVVSTPQTLTALFDPVSGPAVTVPIAMAELRAIARRRNRVACLYKVSARTAVTARREGWCVLRIAEEAVLAPAWFSTNGRQARQLRRKLRQAETGGVIAKPAVHPLPWTAMARVDASWQAGHDGARGTTMGRFTPAHLMQQQSFLAYADGRLCGFASFHVCDGEWCLDLMRTSADAPPGTMHALIVRAIADAAQRGVPRLSLAAVSAGIAARLSAPGLRQFKTAFAPRWQPLYLAAPTPVALAVAAADLALAVRRPPKLRETRICPVPASLHSMAHEHDEDYEFDVRSHS